MAGSSGWALSREGGPTPGSVVLSEKGATTNQRVEERGRWQVAQGLLKKVQGGAEAAARLMEVLASTAGMFLSRITQGGVFPERARQEAEQPCGAMCVRSVRPSV